MKNVSIALVLVSLLLVISIPAPESKVVSGESGFISPYLIQLGDLIFFEWDHTKPDVPMAFGGWDHVAIYVGQDQIIEAGMNWENTVHQMALEEAINREFCEEIGIYRLKEWYELAPLSDGKIRGPLDRERLIELASEFAVAQIGHPYETSGGAWYRILNAEVGPLDDRGYPEEYFCTELVWASYAWASAAYDEKVQDPYRDCPSKSDCWLNIDSGRTPSVSPLDLIQSGWLSRVY